MSAPETDADPRIAPFLALIMAGDRRGAEAEARAVFELRGVRHLYERVIGPALRRIGDLWAANQISVADEHLATATTQSAIASLYPDFPWPEPGPRALFACPKGERHELGLRMAADLLALDGWDDLFLGGDVPLDALGKKVAEVQPALVGLSITLPQRAPALRAAVGIVRHNAPSAKVIAGGRGVAMFRSSVEALEVDVSVHLGSMAVEIARGWK